MSYALATPMKIDIIACFPPMFDGAFTHSIIKRAIDKALVEINIHNLRHHGLGKHFQIDDSPYGGGGGMVLMIEPIVACIEKLQQKNTYDEIIYMTPDGEILSQKVANQLSMCSKLLILCGHYKGIDERVRTHFITREISIGNFVLSGGELPAVILVDSIVRLIPGVLGNESSALGDSFQDGLLAPPLYTRPASFRGLNVPEVLLTGHEANIRAWRHEQALARTQVRRPELLA